MKSKNKTAVKVVIAAIVINLVIGITYIWSMISRELTTGFGWSATQASLPYILSLLVTPIMMIPTGYLADKGYSRQLAAAGGILFGAGFFLCGAHPSVIGFALGYGLCYGTGLGIQTAITASTAMKWYSGVIKGRISGICMAGTAFSSVYMSVLFTWLLKTYGLQNSIKATGIAGMCIILAASVFLRSPDISADDGPQNTDLRSENISWKEMIRTDLFRKTWLILVLADGSALMVIGNIATIAASQANIANASVLIMLIALFNGTGRIAVGALSDRIGISNSSRLVLFLQMANMLAFRFYDSMPLLILGSAVTGFSFGGAISLLNPTASFFGFRKLSQNAAILNTSYGIGGFITPYITAFIVECSGSYNTAYIISAVMLLAALFFTVGLETEPSSRTACTE